MLRGLVFISTSLTHREYLSNYILIYLQSIKVLLAGIPIYSSWVFLNSTCWCPSNWASAKASPGMCAVCHFICIIHWALLKRNLEYHLTANYEFIFILEQHLLQQFEKPSNKFKPVMQILYISRFKSMSLRFPVKNNKPPPLPHVICTSCQWDRASDGALLAISSVCLTAASLGTGQWAGSEGNIFTSLKVSHCKWCNYKTTVGDFSDPQEILFAFFSNL